MRSPRKRRERCLGGWLAVGTVLLMQIAVGPMTADASTTGAGLVGGTVTLPYFPCASCSTTFTGTASMSLSGVGTASLGGVPVPYSAEWAASLGDLSASVTYAESCATGQPSDIPPLSGSAGGTFTLRGGTGVVDASTVPVTLSGDFAWTRVGTFVRIDLTNLAVTADLSGTTVAINLTNSIAGQSATGFVWTNGPGTCSANGQQVNQTAAVVGVVLEVV